MLKTKNIAISTSANQKLKKISDDIKERTDEFVSIGKFAGFLIENFGEKTTYLKINEIIKKQNEKKNIEKKYK